MPIYIYKWANESGVGPSLSIPVEQPDEADEEQHGEHGLHEEDHLLITADLGGKERMQLLLVL